MLGTYLGSFLLQGQEQEIRMANILREWVIEHYVDVKGWNAYDD